MFYITNQGIVVLNTGILSCAATSIRYLLYMKKSLITVIGYKYIFVIDYINFFGCNSNNSNSCYIYFTKNCIKTNYIKFYNFCCCCHE